MLNENNSTKYKKMQGTSVILLLLVTYKIKPDYDKNE